MEKKGSLTLNLPTLKKTNGEISTKNSAKPPKTFSFSRQKGLDLVLIGDFTHSMEAYRETLRRKFKELCSTLMKVIPNIRIGIIFYLDHGAFSSADCYDPEQNPYITRTRSLCTDVDSLKSFIDDTEIGNGIDFDEAVEDALHAALNMNWSENNAHSIVLFGDARPHEPEDCDSGYDYFKITESLYRHKTTINTVYCDTDVDYKSLSSLYEVDIGDFSKRVSRLDHPEFFSWIANVTGGVAIGVEQIDDLVDIIKAMAAKDAGKIDELEKEEKKIANRPLSALEHIKKRAVQIEKKKKALGIGYSEEK